jgi:hypothetical protein
MIVDILAIADIAAISLLAVLLIVCFGYFLLYRLRYNKVLSSLVQLTIDKSAMSEEIDRLHFIQENSVDIENGFIKFLSESREQAFEYIEKVQAAMFELESAMQSGNENLIAEAYAKLIGFLPDEPGNVVK